MRRIIDFHTHPFYKTEENICIYKDGIFPSDDTLKEDMERAGIAHICGTVITLGKKIDPSTIFEQIKVLNRDALKLKEKLGEFYTPGIHVHPDFVKESCEELEFMHAQGIRLIGELVPYAQGWSDYSCKGFSEILDLAGDLGMVVSFHSIDHDQMEKMIASHPGIPFIAAHPNEQDYFMKHLERMRKYKNAYLDLSGTGLFRYGMLKYGVDQVGAERFLFGTDYPICNPAMNIQAVEYERITEEDKEAIFHGNAERLLSITNITN